MEQTNNLQLKMTTSNTFNADDIKETITQYGNNFSKIDDELREVATNKDSLVVGKVYPIGKKIWNTIPAVGDYVGWVNLREGKFAYNWTPLTQYGLGDTIRAKTDNGNIYECIVEGRSMTHIPTFLTNTNVEFYDADGNHWMSNYNYQVDDVVFSTDNDITYYYICETAGLSSLTEPIWSSHIEGTTFADGSAVWRKEKTVKWKQIGSSTDFRPFGKIE